MFCIRFSNRYSFWPNRGLIGWKNLDKTGFRYCQGKKNYVFMFSSKTMQHVCFNKHCLCVAKQSRCIIQTEAHSCKERHPFFITQSLCLNQTRPSCMFEITTSILYVVTSQPWSKCFVSFAYFSWVMEENGGHHLFVLFTVNKLLLCSCLVLSFMENCTVKVYLIKYVKYALFGVNLVFLKSC